MTSVTKPSQIILREAQDRDADRLREIEVECFDTDRLSLRRIKHWIKAQNKVMTVAELDGVVIAYGLALLHRGTRLARLYSIAVAKSARGNSLSKHLLHDIENQASEKGRLFMRLEVARNNKAALNLYKKSGYHVFGTYKDYYDDHQDALRLQKRIRYRPVHALNLEVSWYRQTTDFSCGPAALMMAMACLNPKKIKLRQELELDIWREATTIFMTSGHGGCHPVGLALAAHRRGFKAEVYLNQKTPLFIDGVRSQNKKAVITIVDQHFRHQARQQGVPVNMVDVSQISIEQWLKQGCAVIILISTYRMDGKKTPHWVTVTGMDKQCLYVHDPDPDKEDQTALDCQHLPIAREDFDKMSAFGSEKLRTAVVLFEH
jgi:ribosomal protein S18 acetylase RimI-like enzyme